MIAELSAEKRVFREVLNSISNVVQGEDVDRPMDLNLVAERDTVYIYVRQARSLQVSHKLTNDGEVDLDVNGEDRFVFSSQTLSKLIKNSKDQKVSLKFDHHDYQVVIENTGFSTDLTFDLNLYQDSEFQERVTDKQFHKVAMLNRESLWRNIDMMSTISPEFKIRVEDGELWISVSDVVQGDGEVMKEIEEGSPYIGMEKYYETTATVDFLKALKGDVVSLSLADDGTIKFSSSSLGHKSELFLSPRISP